MTPFVGSLDKTGTDFIEGGHHRRVCQLTVTDDAMLRSQRPVWRTPSRYKPLDQWTRPGILSQSHCLLTKARNPFIEGWGVIVGQGRSFPPEGCHYGVYQPSLTGGIVLLDNAAVGQSVGRVQ